MEPQAKAKIKAAPARPAARDQLLDAASALMTERETIDVSLSDIAARAEVNVALVSYYFGGKEGLLLALAKRNATEALGELDRLLALDIDPVEKFRRHLAGVIWTFFRYPYLNRLLHSLMRDASTDASKEIAEFFAAPLARAATGLIRQAQTAGLMHVEDPMLFYFAALGACEQIFVNQANLKYVYGVDEISDNLRRHYTNVVLDTFMKGCLTEKNGA